VALLVLVVVVAAALQEMRLAVLPIGAALEVVV
jgi:hypothetical protein